MSGYREFSEFYDLLMQDVDYVARAEYILSLFEKHGQRPQSVLDIACGSGSLCAELIRRGIDTARPRLMIDRQKTMSAKVKTVPVRENTSKN